MHLLGLGMKFVLNPGTPTQQTLLNVTDYDFHYQRGYDLAKPVPMTPGDTIGITCTYDPSSKQELPDPPQGATSLRDLGGRLDRRDVPRAGLHDAAQQRARVCCSVTRVLPLGLSRAA